eukprot:6945067-Pyramimonas_sp.AAC.1
MLKKLRRAIKKSPSWRATPSWSVTGDLLRALAMPNWYYKRQQRRGIRGAEEHVTPETPDHGDEIQPPVFRRGHLLQEESAELPSCTGLGFNGSEYEDPLEELDRHEPTIAPKRPAQTSTERFDTDREHVTEHEIQAPIFERCLYLLCRTARQAGRVPAAWHQASCCRLPKHNDKENAAGERPIMIFCGLGR